MKGNYQNVEISTSFFLSGLKFQILEMVVAGPGLNDFKFDLNNVVVRIVFL